MINSKRDVWIAVIVVNVVCIGLVTALLPFLFPPEDFDYHLKLTVVLSALIGSPIVHFMGTKILQLNRLSRKLQSIVDRDLLTNVATRNFFFHFLEEETEREGVSLMVDIDHFKRINDTHGHLVGDRVIQRVAEILSDTVRSSDIVCRFGGEEFAVFLHEAHPREAEQIAERMRIAIAEEQIEVEGTAIAATVSIGLSLKRAGQQISASLSEADQALYAAKNAGRNRIVTNFSRLRDHLGVGVVAAT